MSDHKSSVLNPLLLSCALSIANNNASFCAESLPVKKTTAENATTTGIVQTVGDLVRKKLKPKFAARDVSYPPKKMTWIGLKQEKLLLLFAADSKGAMRHVLTYEVIGTSGVAGPKLKEGDKQIPEGFYKITRFRPHVVAYIGMDLDYPNVEDRRHAKDEKRRKLGGDIMIHGSLWSTGCLAMGDDAIEDLFVLAYDTKPENIDVILAPCNLTVAKPDIDFKKQPSWLPHLYARLRRSLMQYPVSPAI